VNTSSFIGKVSLTSILLLLSVIIACGNSASSPSEPDETLDSLVYLILDTLYHDTLAYTQGLEVHDGVLWEGTGMWGHSSLRRLDLEDGTLIEKYPIPDSLFGEGITVLSDRILHLTWRSGLVLQWSLDSIQLDTAGTIDTEGWGICSINDSVVAVSDGSQMIRFRRTDDLSEIRSIEVTLRGEPQYLLNELEYHDGRIFSNIWTSDRIIRIDPATGIVDGIVSFEGILPLEERLRVSVLNGIAWDPGREAFLITGKYWPKMFVVRLIPV